MNYLKGKMNKELNEEYRKARDEEFKRIKSKLKSIESEIESYKYIIKNLELKRKIYLFELSSFNNDWLLETELVSKDNWEGKRRPTGCK